MWEDCGWTDGSRYVTVECSELVGDEGGMYENTHTGYQCRAADRHTIKCHYKMHKLAQEWRIKLTCKLLWD